MRSAWYAKARSHGFLKAWVSKDLGYYPKGDGKPLIYIIIWNSKGQWMKPNNLTWGTYYNFHFTDEKTKPMGIKYLLQISKSVSGKAMTNRPLYSLCYPYTTTSFLFNLSAPMPSHPSSTWFHIYILGYILGFTFYIPCKVPQITGVGWSPSVITQLSSAFA